MVVFSAEYGYQIYFPKTLEEKLTKLYQTDEESYDEMVEYITKLFPYVYHIHSDMVDTEAFMDWHWDKYDTKKRAQEADKEIQKAIRKWLKNYESKEKN